MKKNISYVIVLIVICLLPVKVLAGGDYDLDTIYISGIKSDKSIDPCSELKFSMDSLKNMSSSFGTEYPNRLKVYWAVSDTEGGSGTPVKTDFKNNNFIAYVDPDYGGKWLTLHTESINNVDTSLSNNTKPYYVNKSTLPTPTNLKATAMSSSSIKLTWSSSHGGNHFIYYKSGSSGYNLIAATSNGIYSKIIDAGLTANTKYTFVVRANRSGSDEVGPSSNEASATTPKQTSSGTSGGSSGGSSSSDSSGSSGGSSSGSGSGGSSGGSSSGSGSYSKPAKLSDANVYVISTTPGTATISMTGHDYGIGVEVYSGNTRIINKLLGYYSNYTTNVSIPYGSTTTFKYRVSRYGKDYSPWGTLSVKSAKLKRPGLSVTKINATKAGLRWSSVGGATGYRIYKGKKLVKTLGKKKSSYIYKGKGAGSAKFYVQAIRKISGKKYASGPKSKAKKGKANVRTYNFSRSTSGMSYGKAAFSPKKISLKGNTYTITCYIKNSRIFKLIKFKKLDITLLCNGKKVAHKKLTNYKVNVKKDGSKKMTIKIKGKGGVDFRNAQGTTIKWSSTPYWEGVGTKPF